MARVYTDVYPKALPMAERAVLAHLEKLEEDGLVDARESSRQTPNYLIHLAFSEVRADVPEPFLAVLSSAGWSGYASASKLSLQVRIVVISCDLRVNPFTIMTTERASDFRRTQRKRLTAAHQSKTRCAPT